MAGRKVIIVILLVSILILQIGCSTTKELKKKDSKTPAYESVQQTPEQDSTTEKKKDQPAVMDYFNALIQKDTKVPEVINFINKNISLVSQNEASIMICRLEEIQMECLLDFEQRHYTDAGIQDKIGRIYTLGFDINEVDKIKDGELKKLMIKTREYGFKVETVEGYYFPVINYEFYKKYNSYVTPDIREYINIMAAESNKPPAKDAGLVISWDEVLRRALKQEEFIHKYRDSIKIEDIKQLYNRYITYALCGADNTPVFDHSSKLIDLAAKEAYLSFIESTNNSNLRKIISGFIDVLKKNGYKLTDEVERHRKGITEANTLKSSKDANRYKAAGIDNSAEFESTFNLVKDLVAEGKKEEIAKYVLYPLEVYINNEKTTIDTAEEFVENHDHIFNDKVKKVFLNQKVEETFVNYQGIMVGQGEIWFTYYDKGKNKYYIYAINNKKE